MKRTALQARSQQRGAALLVLMMILGLLAAYFAISALNGGSQNERNRVNTKAMAQAKEALIGFAATYRDTHPNVLLDHVEVFGYLPCPDIDNLLATNGVASVSPSCPNQNISTTGRLPWNTLGIPALRDNAGECLWYAVSGSAKDVNKTAVFNWDTLGQFIVQDASGNVLAGGAAGAAAHQRPLAVILAPGTAVNQTRAPSASQCSGTTTLTSYLEGIGAPAPGPVGGITTITVATPASVAAGSNNDQAQWITSKDVFDRVKVRSDFRDDIDTMMDELASCISILPTISASSATSKGINNAIADYNANCPPTLTQANVLTNWQNNLLYTNPGAPSTVKISDNGVTYSSCTAVLLFGGERTVGQTRETPANVDIASNYLETTNTIFPSAGAYTGMAGFTDKNASADLVRCIKPFTGQQASFANNFSAFVPNGTGVTTGLSNGVTPPGAPSGLNTVSFNNAAGPNGGCFWYPNAIQLAGKVLRIYYNNWFSFSDPVGGADRGNGFTFQMVRGDIGAPSNCGTKAKMGVLDSADGRGVISYIVETDVHQDAANNDSVENHTAIMYGGNLTHSATNGDLTPKCDGSAAGCRHNPANKFEELPTPLPHSQRIEIHTGCDASCVNCNAAAPLATNSTRVSVWVDCTNCNDLHYDFGRTVQKPTINRCLTPDPEMNSIYFGFTGGFRSGGSLQGVTLWNLDLRTE